MSATSLVVVRLPTHLADYTGGARELSVQGATVREVLTALDERFPGLRFRVVDEAGRLRRHMRIFVGGASSDDLEAAVAPGSDVMIVAALSGG